MKKSIVNYLSLLMIIFLILGCTEKQMENQDSQEMLKNEEQPEKTVNNLELPERFLNILRQEMIQLNGGMGALLSYMIRGQGQEAAEIATTIHNSFILKQELTEEELNQLVSLLPERFIQLDRGFHQLADEIATTLKNEDFEKSSQIYGQMVEACLNCHSQFATERFPSLRK
jgi:hypothetical protein